MRTLAGVGLAVALTLAAGSVHAAEAARSPETETSWYAGQMGAVYAGTVGLVVWNGVTDGRYPPLAAWALLSLTVGAPVLHVLHGNKETALQSLALRGAFYATAVAVGSNCIGPYGSSSDSGWCTAGGVLLLSELLAMPVLDFALAHRTVERSSTGVSLSVLPPSGARPGLLALAGRF